MLLREFLGVIYHKTNLRIIGGNGEDMEVLFKGVRDDVPNSLMNKKVDFIDAELKTDVNDMYVATAGIKIFLE